MGVFCDRLGPVVEMVESEHGDTEVLHFFGCFVVALLAIREVVRGTIDIDDGMLFFVSEIGLRVTLFVTFLGRRGEF